MSWMCRTQKHVHDPYYEGGNGGDADDGDYDGDGADDVALQASNAPSVDRRI